MPVTPREGRAAQSQSTAGGAHGPAARCDAALSHLQAARFLDALLCCQQALAIDPDYADALHLMGLLSLQAGQPDLALQWLARAIQRNPKVEYLANLGHILRQQQRFDDALKAFDKAVQLKPDEAELWRHLGGVLAELKRPADAVLSLQHALKLDPRNWNAANSCGILLHGLARFEEARACFDLCDKLLPDRAATLYMRGRCLIELKRPHEALADTQRALELDGANADIHSSIGFILQALGRHREALDALDKALALRPAFVEALNSRGTSLVYFHRSEEAILMFDRALQLNPAYHPSLLNKAVALTDLHRFDEAFATYDSAKAIDRANADVEWNLSCLYMLTGDLEAGWAASEARWTSKARPLAYPQFAAPRWFGDEPIDGRTVLIYADEGLGDTIQLARYVPMVMARGARVIWAVASAARPLLAGMAGLTTCLSTPLREWPAFDFHCPMSSLPRIFQTRLDTIPPGLSYLPPLPEGRIAAWKNRLGPHSKLRVGLVWSGNPEQPNDHNRSMRLKTLLPILDADAVFVSLQKDPRPDDRTTLRERNDIVDLTAHLADFAETAALISCLDLVVTVCTSVAHLAGALGCPTWIMLPHTPDGRWLLNRDDSPWYPSVRLFRQTTAGDYAGVVDRVRAELHDMICRTNQSTAGN